MPQDNIKREKEQRKKRALREGACGCECFYALMCRWVRWKWVVLSDKAKERSEESSLQK